MSAARLAAVSALLSTVALAAAPAAGTAGTPTGCPQGSYCLWTKQDYEGKRFVVDTGKRINLPGRIDDKASSFKNRVGPDRVVYLYTGKNGNGARSCFFDGEDSAALYAEDQISSTDRRPGNICAL